MEFPLKIAHITDIHIGADDTPSRGIDVRRNFLRVLDSVLTVNPDLIVLGGDLAAIQGEVEAYRWIKEQLDPLHIPYCSVAGNHDEHTTLGQVFQQEWCDQEEWCFCKRLADVLLIGLNSSSGVVTQKQLDWLKSTANGFNKRILLFMHHPPLVCGCRFMDRMYPLQEADRVFDLLSSIENLLAIVCGHYHTEKTVLKNGKTIFISPSTMLQISQTSEGYEVESTRPGWRLIELGAADLKTTVISVG